MVKINYEQILKEKYNIGTKREPMKDCNWKIVAKSTPDTVGLFFGTFNHKIRIEKLKEWFVKHEIKSLKDRLDSMQNLLTRGYSIEGCENVFGKLQCSWLFKEHKEYEWNKDNRFKEGGYFLKDGKGYSMDLVEITDLNKYLKEEYL